jgi:multidrug resistance efflux pump
MNGKRKQLIIGVLVVMVVALSSIGIYYWYNNAFFVATDDAKVTGDIVKVGPQTTGRLLEFLAEEGDYVTKNQILGRQEVLSQNITDSVSIESSIIRAPISGILVKKQANLGEICSSGQTLAMIVDPNKLYVSANIEETKLGRVRQGQTVDITVDQFNGTSFKGKVKSVGEAANSAFSLLPTSTSGTFTKVVQKIPVKIEFDKIDNKLLAGTNAVIKIHVK